MANNTFLMLEVITFSSQSISLVNSKPQLFKKFKLLEVMLDSFLYMIFYCHQKPKVHYVDMLAPEHKYNKSVSIFIF